MSVSTHTQPSPLSHRLTEVKSAQLQRTTSGYLCAVTALATVGCIIGAYMALAHGGGNMAFLATSIGGVVCLASTLITGGYHLISRIDLDRAIDHISKEEYELESTPKFKGSVDKKLRTGKVARAVERNQRSRRYTKVVKWSKRVALAGLLLAAGSLFTSIGLATHLQSSVGFVHAPLAVRITLISGVSSLGLVPIALIIASIFGHQRPHIEPELNRIILQFITSNKEEANRELIKRLSHSQLKELVEDHRFHVALCAPNNLRDTLRFFPRKYVEYLAYCTNLKVSSALDDEAFIEAVIADCSSTPISPRPRLLTSEESEAVKTNAARGIRSEEYLQAEARAEAAAELAAQLRRGRDAVTKT